MLVKTSTAAVYAGTLTAYLTKPSFDKPIDSLEDLLAAYDRGVVASVNSGTSYFMMLKVYIFLTM